MAKKITMQFGKYVLELKKYRQIKGHDDSIPFEGELYCNGTHIAGCWNDGWGGDAQVKPVLGNLALYNEVKKEVEKTNNLFDNPSWFYNMSVVATKDIFGSKKLKRNISSTKRKQAKQSKWCISVEGVKLYQLKKSCVLSTE